MQKNKFVYGTITTRYGPVHLACTAHGLAAVQLGGNPALWLRNIRKEIPTEGEKNPSGVRAAANQIRAYLAGKRKLLRIPIDWSGMNSFQRRVLRAAMRIPYGQTRTYGDLARAIGNPQSARAVGRALGANPIPLVIPCHRVVRSDGKLGGYSAAGGIKIKERLLRMENAVPIQ